jgi:hypothetical protein
MHVLAADHLLLVELESELQEVGRDALGTAAAGAAAEAEDQVERRLLLDVVVRKSAAFLQLLPGEDQTLLVRRDPYTTTKIQLEDSAKWNRRSSRQIDRRIHTFLVLDLGLDVVDGVAALDLEGDGLPRQGLHEDLHLAGNDQPRDRSR